MPTEAHKTILEDGTLIWSLNGKCHREGGPAIIKKNGDKEWYFNGKCHREGGPAVELENGTTVWYHQGLIHHEGAPAIYRRDGAVIWYYHGECHRPDGPALYFPERTEMHLQYWLHGKRITAEDTFLMKTIKVREDKVKLKAQES